MAHSSTESQRIAKAVSGARTAGTITTAAVLLVAPIVLWAQFGDGDPEHAIAVAIVATLACWWFIHRLDFGDARPASPGASEAGRPRSPASASRLDRDRPARPPRPARDVGCAAAGQVAGRSGRRRHP